MPASPLVLVPILRGARSRNTDFLLAPPLGRFPLKNFELGSPRNDDPQLARPPAPPISSYASAIPPFSANFLASLVVQFSRARSLPLVRENLG
jgi:hypothetical protein